MKKKSFLLYYDSYTWLHRLSDEEKGRLFEALFLYALAARERLLSPQEYLQQENVKLQEESTMVFGFMADSIYRDTEKWNAAQETKNRRRAAAEATKKEEPLIATPPDRFTLRSY